MADGDFTLAELKAKFNLTIVEKVGIFKKANPIPPSSPILQSILDRNVPLALAINTEKARSEMIIAPILLELFSLFEGKISLFSGSEFNVDKALGLNGFIDFLISLSPEQLYIESPVAIIVEAKKEDLNQAIPQCIAAMLGAMRFNESHGQSILPIYGVVTTGNLWKFLLLEENRVTIDLNEYYISPIESLLGVLSYAIAGKSEK